MGVWARLAQALARLTGRKKGDIPALMKQGSGREVAKRESGVEGVARKATRDVQAIKKGVEAIADLIEKEDEPELTPAQKRAESAASTREWKQHVANMHAFRAKLQRLQDTHNYPPKGEGGKTPDWWFKNDRRLRMNERGKMERVEEYLTQDPAPYVSDNPMLMPQIEEVIDEYKNMIVLDKSRKEAVFGAAERMKRRDKQGWRELTDTIDEVERWMMYYEDDVMRPQVREDADFIREVDEALGNETIEPEVIRHHRPNWSREGATEIADEETDALISTAAGQDVTLRYDVNLSQRAGSPRTSIRLTGSKPSVRGNYVTQKNVGTPSFRAKFIGEVFDRSVQRKSAEEGKRKVHAVLRGKLLPSTRVPDIPTSGAPGWSRISYHAFGAEDGEPLGFYLVDDIPPALRSEMMQAIRNRAPVSADVARMMRKSNARLLRDFKGHELIGTGSGYWIGIERP